MGNLRNETRPGLAWAIMKNVIVEARSEMSSKDRKGLVQSTERKRPFQVWNYFSCGRDREVMIKAEGQGL